MEAERARFNKKITELEARAEAPRQKVLTVFADVSMRKGHPGLAELAAKQKLKVEELRVGEYLIFVNRPRTALKMFATGNTVAYFKMPEGAGKLDMRTIAIIPRFFTGQKIDYDRAVREILEKALLAKK